MSYEEILRELEALPPEGQQQVADFIVFLRERYGRSQPTAQAHASDLTQESFVGMWRDREDMQDSSAWVRGSRQSEWVKQSG